MAEPTPDSNLALIEELQSLVSADYAKPEGPEFSYPAVGQAVDDEMWKSITLALGDGVLDEGGYPYELVGLGTDSETNSKSQMKLTVSSKTNKAQAVLKGFYHRLAEDMPLDFPMPLSATTYYVVLELNPLKANSPEGPISVKVYPDELNTESGRKHLVLWTVRRESNQLLTDAKIERVSPRSAPTVYYWSRQHLPGTENVLYGTIAVLGENAEILRARENVWESLTSPPWEEEPDGSSYVYTGSGYRVAIQRLGNTRRLRGQWQRAGGKAFYPDSEYLLYRLSPGDRPKKVMRFQTAGPGKLQGGTTVTVTVNVGGEVNASPSREANWMSLDGIQFDLE